MARNCIHCRHTNPEWAEFCGRCGANLLANAPPNAAPPIEPPRPDRHRSTVPPPSPPIKVPSSQKPRRLAWLAVVALMAMGWIWVIKPRARTSHPSLNWGPTPSINVAPRATQLPHFDYRGDKGVAEAIFELLRPNHVSIRVERISGNGVRVTGTTDEIGSIKLLLDAIDDRSTVHRSNRQWHSYALPPDQSRALGDLLETAGRRIHIESKRGTLQVRAPRAVHDAIGRVIQHLNVNTMTDISYQQSP